jgi:hypothetical protein
MTQNVDEPYIQKAVKPTVSLSSRLRSLSLEMRSVAHEMGLQRRRVMSAPQSLRN